MEINEQINKMKKIIKLNEEGPSWTWNSEASRGVANPVEFGGGESFDWSSGVSRGKANPLINETTGDTYIAYHGTTHKITKFVDSFIGGDTAVDHDGPGIYFASTSDNAGYFGNIIYKVELNPRRFLVDKDMQTSEADIKKLIMMAEDWEGVAVNFGSEDPEIAIDMAVDSILKYNETEKDIYLQIYQEFYTYTPLEYTHNMIKLGFDGLMVDLKDSDGIVHYIVYNPAIITPIK